MALQLLNSHVPIGTLCFWTLLLTAKHLTADFLLQNRWMSAGKEANAGWALPLVVHCSIHGFLTTGLVWVFEPSLWFLGIVDFAIHFVTDRAKGFLNSTCGLTGADTLFWWLLGIDQAIHHLTDFGLAIIVAINR